MIEAKHGEIIFNIKYGDDSSQMGDLYIPNKEIKGTICLFNGGFWKMPYDLHQFDQISKLLLMQGFIVWNIEELVLQIENGLILLRTQ